MADVFKVEGSVSLDTSSFNAEVDKASQAGKQLASDIGEQSNAIKNSLGSAFSVSIGNILSDIAKEAGRAAVEFVSDSISIASSLEEVQNVVDVTFGDGAAQLEQWANNARTQFGLTELQAKQYASTMGAMLKSMGMSQDDVYDMSTAMAGLAADMASFYNIDFDEAFSKIRSGISGETEPLKQLGINLSVANLEAYALSKGITTAYESMSQAEQATLRYNYMLEATADAQGDFARTSDGYANNLRMLETNIDSLKASIGESFLPVVNDVISAINSLFNNEKSVEDQLSSLSSGFEENTASIVKNQAHANALLDVIEDLENKQELTTEESIKYKGAMDALLAIYPDLEGYVDSTTGKFTESASAIRAETEALAANMIEKAKIAYFEERLTTAAKNQAKAEMELSEAYANHTMASEDAEAASEKLIAAQETMSLMGDVLANAFDAKGIRYTEDKINSVVSNLEKGMALREAMANGGLGPWYGNLPEETVEFIDGVSESYANLKVEQEDAILLEQQANDALKEKKAAFEEADAVLKREEELLRAKTEELKLQNQIINEGTGATGSASEATTELKDNTKDFTTTLKELKKEGENVQRMFDEIEQYKLNNLENIRKKVEGVYDSFEKVGRVRKQSGKKMLGNNADQVKQLERFSEAYKQLQEAGATDQLMSQFDYSTESIGQMEAILKDIASGKRSIDDYNTSVSELQTKQDEVATMLANTSENVDTTLANMQTAAEQASADLTNKMNSIVADAAAMQASVTTAGDTATGAVNTLQTAGDALGLSTWEPTLDAEDNATSIINAVKSALGILDGKSATVKIYTERVEGGKPHATGLDYVPYDEYAARLHKGEAVLTKAEADNWRKGTKAYQTDQPITINLTVNGVSSNPYEIASEVKHALELLRWQG